MRTCAFALVLAALAGAASGREPHKTRRPLPLASPVKGLNLDFHWNADAYANLAGGRRRGYATDSVLYAGLGLDTGALGAWDGGTFRLELQAIASTHPSAYAGDLQTLSNLDAPNRRQIAKLWYSQAFGKALVRAGIMDLNGYFDDNDAAALFANSSFGIIPSISANVPTPIYPDFGWGVMTRLGEPGDDWLLGAFQGNPADRASALHAGATLIAERDWRDPATGSHIGIGAWYRRVPVDAGLPASDWGAYANLEHALPHHPTAVGFVQLGVSPGQANQVPVYLGAGIRFYRISSAVGDVGIGMARAWIRGRTAETSLETTATFPIAGAGFAIQPDLQYIFHPSGIRPNALVVGLRLHLALY